MNSLSYEEEQRNLPFEGFEHYQVSNHGRVRNGNTCYIRRAKDNGNGYLCVTLKSHGKMKHIYIHREVARLFLDDFDESLQVNHIDKDKSHNYVSNLNMVTDSQNKEQSKEEYLQGHLKKQGKIVQVFDRDGNIVKKHLGLQDFCRVYNCDPRSIQRVIKGQKKSYHGFTFKYK